MKKTLFFLLSIFSIFCIFHLAEAKYNKNWQRTTVDKIGWVGIDPMIALDQNNYPHISYYDQGKRNLKYAYYNGENWKRKVIDKKGDVGEESGIAIDDDGYPHISYIDVTNGDLKYAYKNADGWHKKVVDKLPDNHHPVSTSIAIDSEGHPHIAYNFQKDEDEDENNNDQDWVKYAYWNGKKWKKKKIIRHGSDVILALDSNNKAHLSFKKELDPDNNPDQYRIYYATNKSGKWKTKKIDKKTQVGGDTGIAVGPNNHAHIAYHDYKNKTIRYAFYNGFKWKKKTVARKVGKDEGLKIAVDENNKPHIIFANNRTEKLIYAVKNGNSWTREKVGRMGNPAIKVDSKGRVHVAYNNSYEKNADKYDVDEIEILKYAVRE